MEKIRVYNRSNSTVFYKDEETNKTRVWEPSNFRRESYKDLSFEEIERVVNTRGGKVLFEEYLLIKDKNICDKLEINYTKEYFYDEKEVRHILEKGTEFDLIEMIKNSTEGIKDLIKQIAIEIKLDSSRKREIIKQYLKFDVNFAINNDLKFDNELIDKKEKEEVETQIKDKPIYITKTGE